MVRRGGGRNQTERLGFGAVGFSLLWRFHLIFYSFLPFPFFSSSFAFRLVHLLPISDPFLLPWPTFSFLFCSKADLMAMYSVHLFFLSKLSL